MIPPEAKESMDKNKMGLKGSEGRVLGASCDGRMVGGGC